MDKVNINTRVQAYAPSIADDGYGNKPVVICTAKFTKHAGEVTIEFKTSIVLKSPLDGDCFVEFEGIEREYVMDLTKPISGWVDDIILSAMSSVAVKKKATHTHVSPYKNKEFVIIDGEPNMTLQHYDIRYGDYMNFIVSRRSMLWRGSYWKTLDDAVNLMLQF